MKQHKQFLLEPCRGIKKQNIPSGHLYFAKDTLNQTTLGFITLEDANKKFGKGKFDISKSHTICSDCSNDIKNVE